MREERDAFRSITPFVCTQWSLNHRLGRQCCQSH